MPSSVDWVSAGAVTAIKDQGTCGSCYSFASTGALEGAYEIAGYTLTSFSEEMIVQCADDGVNLLGCDGGNADSVFGWIESHGLASESAYPYTSSQTATYSYAGACDTAKESSPVVELTGFQDVTANDEIALKAAVAQQPVAVAIDASGNDFQSYASGVYDSTTCTTQTDHAVLIVGYGTDPTGGDYWKVKNSWGTSWGEAGYIRMKRGVNMCGIATEASYPTGVGPYSPRHRRQPTPTPGAASAPTRASGHTTANATTVGRAQSTPPAPTRRTATTAGIVAEPGGSTGRPPTRDGGRSTGQVEPGPLGP